MPGSMSEERTVAQQIYENEWLKGFSEGLGEVAEGLQQGQQGPANRSGRPRNDTLAARLTGNQTGGARTPGQTYEEEDEGRGGALSSIGSVFGPVWGAAGSAVESVFGGSDEPRQQENRSLGDMLTPETLRAADDALQAMLSGRSSTPFAYETEMSRGLNSILAQTADRSAATRGQLADMGMMRSGTAANAMTDIQRQGMQQQASLGEQLLQQTMQHRVDERSRALNALYQSALAQNQAGQLGLQRQQMASDEDDALLAALDEAAGMYGYSQNRPEMDTPDVQQYTPYNQRPPSTPRPQEPGIAQQLFDEGADRVPLDLRDARRLR